MYIDLYDSTNGQDTPPFFQTVLGVRVNRIGKFWKCQGLVTMATNGCVTTGLMVWMGEVGTRVRAVGGGR